MSSQQLLKNVTIVLSERTNLDPDTVLAKSLGFSYMQTKSEEWVLDTSQLTKSKYNREIVDQVSSDRTCRECSIIWLDGEGSLVAENKISFGWIKTLKDSVRNYHLRIIV